MDDLVAQLVEHLPFKERVRVRDPAKSQGLGSSVGRASPFKERVLVRDPAKSQ